MFDNTDSDFWKEIFVHLLHKNMVRTNAEKLSFQNCKSAFESFSFRHPDLSPNVDFSDSYATWEIFVTSEVKLRLFIQSTIKGTLYQYEDGDYTKIADAKFPYDPFPEIEEFLSHVKEYESELNSTKTKKIHTKKQLELSCEFIKAFISEKIKNSAYNNSCVWNLEIKNFAIVLTLDDGKEKKSRELSPTSWKPELEKFLNL